MSEPVPEEARHNVRQHTADARDELKRSKRTPSLLGCDRVQNQRFRHPIRECHKEPVHPTQPPHSGFSSHGETTIHSRVNTPPENDERPSAHSVAEHSARIRQRRVAQIVERISENHFNRAKTEVGSTKQQKGVTAVCQRKHAQDRHCYTAIGGK